MTDEDNKQMLHRARPIVNALWAACGGAGPSLPVLQMVCGVTLVAAKAEKEHLNLDDLIELFCKNVTDIAVSMEVEGAPPTDTRQ